MTIELKDIATIAHLARLELSPTEQQEALDSINNILVLINQMQAANTSQVLPLAHAYDASQRCREDIVTETDQRELLLSGAPSSAQGLFLVPKVLE